ncbi:MAG: endonuclease III [Oscillospiraceae bacterium]|nr:endonuclease III [Oscillospiraceae bacterium]
MKLSKKNIALQAEKLLEKLYPDAECSLTYETPLQLLIATRLSAQCTDKRVNIVTKDLFSKYKSVYDFKEAKEEDIADCIKSCGLYKTKARDIKLMAEKIISDYEGQVPDTLEKLLTLPGVGRKTANLIMGDVYGKPAVVTDTHCIRISGRLGLTENTDPKKVEFDLLKLLTPETSSDFCHRIVLFGREYCRARNPLCFNCPLKEICKENKNGKKTVR